MYCVFCVVAQRGLERVVFWFYQSGPVRSGPVYELKLGKFFATQLNRCFSGVTLAGES